MNDLNDLENLFEGVMTGNNKNNDEKELSEARKKIETLEKENESLKDKLNGAFEAKGGGEGKPLLLPIDDVIEDPQKPNTRTQRNPEFEDWLTKNIAEQSREGGHGIQDPISVRWSEEHQKWIINKGHTRRRCGKAAGLKHVPAIIQDESTDWNQVIENIMRDGLPAKDMVKFIKRKKNEGISQTEIAKRLSTNKGWVSKHVALIDPPVYVQTIWDNGYATEYIVLYSLVTLYKKDPEFVESEVNKIIGSKSSITKPDIDKIQKKLGKAKEPEEVEEVTNEEETKTDEKEEPETSDGSDYDFEVSELRLKAQDGNRTGFVVLCEPKKKGYVVIELSNGEFMEVEAKKVKLLGVATSLDEE